VEKPVKLGTLGVAAGVAVSLASIAACSSGSSGPPQLVEAGTRETSTATPEGGADAPVADGGFTLQQAPPVDPGSLQAGQLLLTASGEQLAIAGYNFPAKSPGDSVFADGWQVTFDHFIATFDKVALWTNPDMVPTDQSQHGPLVAELDGPWAVDMSKNDTGWPYIDGKETGERAVAFAVLTNQNKNGGAAFPVDGTRFAVGFSAVVATTSALNVNLDADGLAYYQTMVQNGCVTLYVGTATYDGDKGACTGGPVDAGLDASVLGGTGQEPEFARIPKQVRFELCFKPRTGNLKAGDAETTWINCDNQDNSGPPSNMEPHQRGVAFRTNAYTIGEVTFHTDHPFWESTQHDTPAHFDQFAAQATGSDAGVPTVHLDDLTGVDYTAITDKQGMPVPWRICDPSYQNPSGGSRVGQMHFDPVKVPHCTGNDSSNGLCDLRDFSKYNQSTQGHWNGADGLCFVQRDYPSPP
jgi:hypothetical protein